MSLTDRLAVVFENAFGLDKSKFTLALTPEETPNWDSVGHMNLVNCLEQEFQVQFEVDDIMEMSSPEKIVEILKAKGVAE